jgi:chromosomal replication initiation ATPase DnaA
MSAHRQPPLLALELPRRRAMGRADFIESAANAAALALVCDPGRWPSGRLALVGPAASGKTHLVHVLMAGTGAVRVEAPALSVDAVPSLAASGCIAVEDADRMGGAPDQAAAEAALFHLLNLAGQEGASVLLTGRDAPARWPVALPDLASRLAALTPVRLAAPDDALLAAVIGKLLADRHLRHEPGLPDYLAARIERSFAAAQALVAQLDAASLAERRNLTKAWAGTVLATQVGPISRALDGTTQNGHE